MVRHILGRQHPPEVEIASFAGAVGAKPRGRKSVPRDEREDFGLVQRAVAQLAQMQLRFMLVAHFLLQPAQQGQRRQGERGSHGRRKIESDTDQDADRPPPPHGSGQHVCSMLASPSRFRRRGVTLPFGQLWLSSAFHG